jgi:hypothetical protein
MKPELVRTVQMGPWQHKVDDGLEARKTAYETLYTLVYLSIILGPGTMYANSRNS